MNFSNNSPTSIQKVMPPSLPEIRILANIIDTLQIKTHQQLLYSQTPNFNSRLPLFYFENLAPSVEGTNPTPRSHSKEWDRADNELTPNKTVEPLRPTSPNPKDGSSISSPMKMQNENSSTGDGSKMYTVCILLLFLC